MINSKPRPQESVRFLSFRQVEQITGLSRSTIYRQMKRGAFPKPRILAERKVGFATGELNNWIEAREVTSA